MPCLRTRRISPLLRVRLTNNSPTYDAYLIDLCRRCCCFVFRFLPPPRSSPSKFIPSEMISHNRSRIRGRMIIVCTFGMQDQSSPRARKYVSASQTGIQARVFFRVSDEISRGLYTIQWGARTRGVRAAEKGAWA